MRRVLPLPDDDEVVVRANAAAQTLAGVAVVVGPLRRPAALALIGFLIPTTIAGHAFWRVEDPTARKMQQVQFVKNLAMIGGLLAVAAEPDRGPGACQQRTSTSRVRSPTVA